MARAVKVGVSCAGNGDVVLDAGVVSEGQSLKVKAQIRTKDKRLLLIKNEITDNLL